MRSLTCHLDTISDFGGAFENLQRATSKLQLVVPVALGLIFIMVFLALWSLKQTIMIYIAIPLSSIGGVFSLWIRDMPFSISAGIGFIVLFGIAVLNGLVLINGWNDLKNNTSLNLHDRILQGAKRRIRPILLTASTDILGFLPMALSQTAGAEVQRPLATVVIGGMISATILTLFILPVLYRWVENRDIGIKIPGKVTLVFLILILIGIHPTNGQDSNYPNKQLTIEQAITRATTDYPSISAAQLNVSKQQDLKKTAWDFGRTGIFTAGEELGEDDLGVTTTIGIQQQNIDLFSIPAKTKLQEAKIEVAKANQNLTLLQVEQQVKIDYGNAYVAQRKLSLLEQIDSVYQIFEGAVELKYQLDESSRLEYLAASNQAQQVRIRKEQAHYDLFISLNRLNKWFLSDTLFTINEVNLDWLSPVDVKDSVKWDHPILQLAQTQLTVSEQAIKAQKAGYLPKLNAMYGAQEINGVDGFYQFQAGLSFPLIFNKQQGMVQAASVEREISQQNLNQAAIELNTNFQVTQFAYEKWLRSWEYYQEQAIPQAREQLNGATLSYQAGAIDYIEFLQNTHAALSIELNGLNALAAYLQSKFALEYLLNN